MLLLLVLLVGSNSFVFCKSGIRSFVLPIGHVLSKIEQNDWSARAHAVLHTSDDITGELRSETVGNSPSSSIVAAAGTTRRRWRGQFYAKEVLAGLVVTLATLPTSISYSTVVGVSPVIGIWNSAITGLLAALVGGAPGANIILITVSSFGIYSCVI